MTVRRTLYAALPRQRGMSLIEIMIGVVIGLIATAIIFQTFAVSEGFRRNTTNAGDAQQNGLFSTFTLALELANAGNGLATAALMLDSCPKVNNAATTLRPIPALIQPGGSNDVPDTFFVSYSVSPTLVYPAPIMATTAAGGNTFQVQSALGFNAGDLVLAVSPAGACQNFTVTNVSALNPGGIRTLTVATPAASAFPACAPPAPCGVLPLGPANRVQRARYDVVDSGGGACTAASTNCVLRSLDLIVAGAQPVPIASNIVNMKLQYGVDTDGDGLLDTWVSSAVAPWRPADVLAATIPEVNRIKAVRIGFIVRSAQYERDMKAALPPNGDFNWVLFDCETHDNACPGRLTGIIAADGAGGGFRHRVYETVVPLRNQLWNKQL